VHHRTSPNDEEKIKYYSHVLCDLNVPVSWYGMPDWNIVQWQLGVEGCAGVNNTASQRSRVLVN
jgi:hypothetical protein